MKSGTGFFLLVGIGIGVGLFSGVNWWWQGIIGIIIITILHIITKSDLYKDSIKNCEERNQTFSLKIFIPFNLVSNTLIFGVVFVIVRLIFR